MKELLTRVPVTESIPGSELDARGNVIKVHAALRQIVPGDVLRIEWEMLSPQVGTWVAGLVTKVLLREEKSPLTRQVLCCEVFLDANWYTAGFDMDRTQSIPVEVIPIEALPGAEAVGFALEPTLHKASYAWSWDLRTDDIPGWNLFVIGHDCRAHGDELCPVLGRDKEFGEAHARVGGQRAN